ncbi:MAG: AAA family ATPase [Clostridia bacterium]|nr:AAA family ATPase [Clostridia bacterium]
MICFKEAILVRFGKFHDLSLPFSDGIQLIYGGNETGKSTIQLFFKVMLYGVSGAKKDSRGIKLRERMIPWEEKSAEGILRLEADGRSLEIRRKFGKTASGDKTEVLDLNTGEAIPDYAGKTLGEELLGIPESVFEKTLWLEQEGAFFAGADEEINRRLMNLMETGEEEVSSDRALLELEKEKRTIKAKDKRSAPGELDKLWSAREEKMQERYRLLSERGQREAEERVLESEKRKLEDLKQEETRLLDFSMKKKRLLALDARRKKWNEAEKLLHFAEQAKKRDVYLRFSSLDEALVQKAEILEKRREILDQTAVMEYDIEKEDQALLDHRKKEKQYGMLILFGAAFLLCAVLFAVLRISLWSIWITCFGIIGIALVVISFWKMQHAKNSAWKAAENKRRLLDTQRETQAERDTLQKEYTELLSPYHCKNAAELREGFLQCVQAQIEADGYLQSYTAMMEGEDVAALKTEVEESERILAQHTDLLAMNVDEELLKLRQEQLDAVAKIKETESKLSYVYHGGKNPADTETELIHINQKITELEKRQTALELAMKVLEKVAERRKSDFTPKVNERVDDFLGILTGGKYQDVRVSEEYRLRLLPDQTHLYQAEFFSAGTYEQVYLALRLALASLLGDGTEPLFLDDFLMAYDDGRAELAMGLLKELAKHRQIIFFSCHGREVENAKKRNVAIRYLEEERENGC